MKSGEFAFNYLDFIHQASDIRSDIKFNKVAVHGFLQLTNSTGIQWKKKMILAGILLLFSISSYAGDSTGTAGLGGGSNDVLDSMIGVVIILFILSVITEKTDPTYTRIFSVYPSRACVL